MEALKRTNSANHRKLLRLIGFTDDEIEHAISNVRNIPLYEDVAEAQEYASTPEIVKSCSSEVVHELLIETSNAAVAQIRNKREVYDVILSHTVALLADELNVVCTLHEPGENAYQFIRIPQVTIN